MLKIKNNSGQALIETIWIMPLFISVFNILILICYYGLVSNWGSFINYETNLCFSMSHPKSLCENYYYKKIKPILFLSEIKTLNLTKNGTNFTCISAIDIGGLYEINFRSEIDLQKY